LTIDGIANQLAHSKSPKRVLGGENIGFRDSRPITKFALEILFLNQRKPEIEESLWRQYWWFTQGVGRSQMLPTQVAPIISALTSSSALMKALVVGVGDRLLRKL
jgi:hypothetical protein